MQKARSGSPTTTEDGKAAALTKAALEYARQLGFTPAETAAALGVPQGAVASMKKGERAVDGLNGEAARADAIVRLAKRLQALLGDAETTWRSWLRRENAALDAKPIDLVQQRDGVLKVAAYVEKERSL